MRTRRKSKTEQVRTRSIIQSAGRQEAQRDAAVGEAGYGVGEAFEQEGEGPLRRTGEPAEGGVKRAVGKSRKGGEMRQWEVGRSRKGRVALVAKCEDRHDRPA